MACTRRRYEISIHNT